MDQTRRRFLTHTLALGCTAAASPLATPLTFAATPGDNRLIVIILRGGMDGLDIIRPLGDPLLATYRPSLTQQQHRPLDDYYALHPGLAGLEDMWKRGELAFANSLATPYRHKRSHFDGQDLLEAGVTKVTSDVRDSGWLNRALEHIPGAGPATTITVGHGDMLLARGVAPVLSWSPNARIDLSAQAQDLLARLYDKDPLFAEAGQTAMTLAAASQGLPRDAGQNEEAMMASVMDNMMASHKAVTPAALAQFVADRMQDEARIAAFSIGGFDTHHGQRRAIKGGLKNLQAALVTLKRDLGPVWAKTTVMCMTEFGRTVRENGSKGTDHGTGGAMILAGGAVRGRHIYGSRPRLAEADLFEGRDLMPDRDIRSYAAWGLHDLFGVEASALGSYVFPSLDLGRRPGFLL